MTSGATRLTSEAFFAENRAAIAANASGAMFVVVTGDQTSYFHTYSEAVDGMLACGDAAVLKDVEPLRLATAAVRL